MLALGWLLAFLAALAVIVVLPAVAWFEVRRAHSGKRRVTCPETKTPVDLTLDAALAARSRFSGTTVAKVATCSRWPLSEACGEGCVPEALTQNKPDTFTINHLAVVIAGLASTAVADLLRCSPIARDWMVAAGYSPVEFAQRHSFRVPAVLDLIAMIVLAYVITWTMRHTHLSGVGRGIETAALFWLAVVCLSIPEVVFFFPVKIFAMNALLKLLALLVQGLLIGWLVVPAGSPLPETSPAK